MSDRLREEIKQARAFGSLEEEAVLNLHRTSDQLARATTELLERHGLTLTQYNVLRILRGAGERGLPVGEIGERMVTRGPDVTRLVDRLQRQGLVARERPPGDRRVVHVRITSQGLALLGELDEPVQSLHRAALGHLGRQRLRALVELLEEARGPTA